MTLRLMLAAMMLTVAAPLVAHAEDEKPIHALFVCGGCCHDYTHQKKIIPEGISARANVEWTIAYDADTGTKHLNPVYENKDWYKGFDVIVHDECEADVKDLDIINDTILKPHKDGLPGVVLHCGMHSFRSEGWPKVVTPWFEFTGLQTTGHGAQIPIEITYLDKESPITKGLDDWTTIHEELYNNIAGHVLDTAHPLARGKQISKDKNGKETANETTVVWTNLYNGKTRVFATTIGHNNETCNDPKYLDLLTHGLLWSLNKLDAEHMKPAKKVYMDGAEPKADVKSDDKKPASPKTESSAQVGPKADANGMVPLDLARGKTASASSNQGEEHVAGMAFDGDAETRWCAANGDLPQWLQVDLGKPQDLTGFLINWEKENEAYKYKVEGSADGKIWNTLLDQTQAGDGPATPEHKFASVAGKSAAKTEGIRYVRLTVTEAPGGVWASLFDFQVFGKEMVKATVPTKARAAHTADGRPITIKPPAGFDATLFAAPPDASYCTAVSAAPTGAVFIGIDEDGSLGKKPDRGRVIRAIDSKGTGVADQFTIFAKMDHPRGLIWDDGKLFVLHPPFLSVYYDDNNTGIANRSEVLVTGISNEKMVETRGADHTTNGIRLGIDGWIYIATGDFGCVKAIGVKDKTELQFHYGGILRIRPDGTGLEVYSYGTRNIYDVAIDPLMNVFTRDNTNDGDAWNDRLAYDVPTGYYGYPSRFMHFPGEFIDCLADFGGGAPCGSLFLDEPGLPGGLYTVEWGNSQIDRHPMMMDGANFKLTGALEKFMDLPRGTDLDVDAESHLYATSWAGGGFDYSGPNVGYVARLTPQGYKPQPFPELRKLADDALMKQLTSASHTGRVATQREILRRGDKPVFSDGLVKLINSEQPLPVRVAALFTLKLLEGDKANVPLEAATQKPELREFALRALIDKKNDAAVPVKPFITALTDTNPRVRLVAAWGLGRLGHTEAAPELLPLTADSDYLVAHVAIRALANLKAVDVCLNAVAPSTSPGVTAGALRVLQEIHDVKVVNGLIERTPKLQDASVRSLAYRALCRLCYQEAEWDGGWWGTRPDRTGPYYKNAEWAGTQAVTAALHNAVTTEKPEIVHGLVVDLQKHQISFPELQALMAKLAATDPGIQAVMLETLSTTKKLAPDQIAALHAIAINDKAEPAMRAKAVRVLTKDAGNALEMDAAADAIAPLLSVEKPAPELSALRDEFIHDPQFAKHVAYFGKLAESESPAKRELAYSVLMNLASSRLVKPEYKTAASKAIDKGWDRPANAALMLRSVARTHADAYGDMVQMMLTDKNSEIAQAAASAADKLGLKHGPIPARVLIESMMYEDVLAAVLKEKGSPALGQDLFQRQGCIACHTLSTKEPQKGPMLGGIAGRYNRSELCESIMKPSAKIAQGFETQWFKTNDGDVVEGFVSREGGNDIEVRNPTGVAITLKKADIKLRGKREISMMPEGLVVKLTPEELASLIAYLESTTGK